MSEIVGAPLFDRHWHLHVGLPDFGGRVLGIDLAHIDAARKGSGHEMLPSCDFVSVDMRSAIKGNTY